MSRTFVRGCGGPILCNLMTVVMMVINVFTCVGCIIRPHRTGTGSLVFGKRRCFTTSRCRGTIGNSRRNCPNFLRVTSSCDDAGTNGLTTLCANLDCTGLNGCRRTMGFLRGCDGYSSTVVSPTTLNTLNGYCTRLNGLRGTTGALLRTTRRTSGGSLDPLCLVRTNRVFRGLNGGRSTLRYCRLVGRRCIGSVRCGSVSGCVRHMDGWTKA